MTPVADAPGSPGSPTCEYITILLALARLGWIRWMPGLNISRSVIMSSYPMLTTEEVRRSVAKLPRLDLAHLPTPLEEIPRFSERIGGARVFIKRDDCTGLLFGGNK